MFTMSQTAYGYSSQASTPRNFSASGTSSAFSSSAHPDEDWTKISDLAERRRIQNRIAQRNYRKKLKRRLEDLERRAGSSDEGEPEKKPQAAAITTSKSKRQSSSKAHKSAQAVTASKQLKNSRSRFTPPMENSDDAVFASQGYSGRERSRTPPMFSYPSYPAPDDLLMDPYASTQPYPSISTPNAFPNYITGSTPVTLPAMATFDSLKPNEDNMSPYVAYSSSYIPSMEVNMPSHFGSSNAHEQTPPLSHSYDNSASCSEAGYEHPTTPLSMPGSPGMVRGPQ